MLIPSFLFITSDMLSDVYSYGIYNVKNQKSGTRASFTGLSRATLLFHVFNSFRLFSRFHVSVNILHIIKVLEFLDHLVNGGAVVA